MDYFVDKIFFKKRTVSTEERRIIDVALIHYQIDYNRTRKIFLNDIKSENEEEKKPITVNEYNPFDYKPKANKETDKPSEDDIRRFVYTRWAMAVGNTLTPKYADGHKRKIAMRKAIRDVSNGKFINSRVKEAFDNFKSLIIDHYYNDNKEILASEKAIELANNEKAEKEDEKK